jgi:hypothetical protein
MTRAIRPDALDTRYAGRHRDTVSLAVSRNKLKLATIR